MTRLRIVFTNTKAALGLMCFIALITAASTGQAAFVSLTGDPQALNTLPANQLRVADKLFSGFALDGMASGGALAPDLSTLKVQGGFETATGDVGLRFTTSMNAGNGQMVNGLLSFKVAVIQPPNVIDPVLIKDVSMVMTGVSSTGNGMVNIAEVALAGPNMTDPILASLSVAQQPGSPLADLSDSAVFALTPMIWIRKDISVTGGQVGAAHLSEFFQFYSQNIQVPEPGTIVLMSVGLVLAGGIGLRRRRRA